MRNEPPPPPPSDHAPDAGAKPETAPKRKQWSAPTLKIMEMIFTEGGYNDSTHPNWLEGSWDPSSTQASGPTYRTS